MNEVMKNTKKIYEFAKVIMIISALLLALALTILPQTQTALASNIYHMPVIVQSALLPEVLMPGDTALLTITLKNGAAQYGTGGEGVDGMTLSTPVNKTTLIGTDEIEVSNGDNNKVGMIGPNDEIILYYNIKANEGISDGIYLLDFYVDAGYDSSEIYRQIPVKVDSTNVSISRAEQPSNGQISLDIANPRQNTLNAVTIVPTGEGVEFSPEKYYIGTMKPDEIFTIKFDTAAKSPSSQNHNMSFKSVFKNGDTWHESETYNMTTPVTDNNPSGLIEKPSNANSGGAIQAGMATVTAILLLTGLIGGVALWRKKKIKPKA